MGGDRVDGGVAGVFLGYGTGAGEARVQARGAVWISGVVAGELDWV